MNGRTNGLRKLDAALSAGDLEGARETLFRLTEPERDLLRVRLGGEGVDRLYRSARRRRRGAPEGRVVALPGLLGTQIDSLDETGDSDRIWLNPLRILGGRIGELQLGGGGTAL